MAGAQAPTGTPLRTGFKRNYAAGTLDSAAVQALFDDIKAALVATGFTQVINTATEIDVLRAGYPVGTADDDVPHWAFNFESFSATSARIQCFTVYGGDFLSGEINQAELINTNRLVDDNDNPLAAQVWFACDGPASWWWLVCTTPNAGNASGCDAPFVLCGCTSRRYPSDPFKGLSARYGLWTQYGDWYVAYALDPSGNRVPGSHYYTWSPLGLTWSNNSKRHPGSPLPRMVTPQFPVRESNITVVLLGELNEVFTITDGYTLEEAPIAGWIAFPVGTDWSQPFALPAPEQFAVGP